MSSGKKDFDFADPGNLVPHTGKGNQARKIFFDPLSGTGAGLTDLGLYDLPNDPPTAEELARQEEARKAALRAQVNGLFDPGNQQLLDEEKNLGDANRGYYTDALNRASVKAERNTRFNLARQGLLGGSEDVNQQGEVQSDKELGATRIDETVRKAVTGLQESREQARLQGIGLVNAGAGDEGVRSASAGLKQAFDNASSASKADLTSDLFANAADAYTMQQNNAANRALLNRYQQQLATFFPTSANSGGRVTPSS